MSKVTLTVACPETERDDATHLAVALGWIEGWTPDEWQHAFTAQYRDEESNLYRVMSCPVRVTFVANAVAMGAVQRPPQDVEPFIVDLTGARRAQEKLVMWQRAESDPESGISSGNPVPRADPTRIVAVAGMKGAEALAAMGLVPTSDGHWEAE